MDLGLRGERHRYGRNQVEHPETAIKHEQDDIRSAESGELTSREHGQTLEEMLDAIRDSLSDLVCSDNEEDGEGEDYTDQGKLSEVNEPGRIMGTIPRTIQQRMEIIRQTQMKLDELTQPGWGDAADYLRKRDKAYGKTELKAPAVVKRHMDDDLASSALRTFG
jgi:hypothetical protein